MSTASSTANLLSDASTVLRLGADSRRWALRMCQAMVLLPLLWLMLLPEYVQGLGDAEAKSIVYRTTMGPFRLVDLLLLAMIAAHAIAWASSRRWRVRLPREIAWPGMGFLGAIVLAMGFGAMHGGTNLFFDWRALALGIGVYVPFALWLQTPQAWEWALQLFAGFMALRILWIFAEFFSGGGDVLVGVRIPVFDGPTLSAVVFTALLAMCLGGSAPGWRSVIWMGFGAAAYVLVLLCFRRTFWAELGIASLALLLIKGRRRGRNLLLAVAAIAAAAAILGPAFVERIHSMDFTQDETEFSQGNPDHVGEVLDAWEQVKRNPVMGIGLGRSFQALRIQEWKEDSVMVHNAPLHVWLKYGLLGLACYVWFHAAGLRWLWRARGFGNRNTDDRDSGAARVGAFQGAAMVYLAAQFAVSLGFAPWPYSSLQSAVLTAFVLAMSIAGERTWNYQPSRWSLRRSTAARLSKMPF